MTPLAHHTRFRHATRALLASALLITLAGCATSTSTTTTTTTATAAGTGSRLYPDLDRLHVPITTSSHEAQRWFNQGMQLLYGFNHGEAIRSFQEAAALDPDAAMPWWGIAVANGMHINVPEMTEPQWQAGFDNALRALNELDNETDRERALVEACASRYTWPAPAEQRPYDEAYAQSMREVHARFPDDPDIAVLYVESLMNLQPWDYWTPEKAAKGNTAEFVDVLEDTLTLHPNHPQACHLYIHAMEAGPDPSRALAAANRLGPLVPGAGHLVHMPSHIYARLGMYAEAVDANEEALEADARFFAQGTDPGTYYVYHAHNLHFLAFAAMMEGRYEPAMRAARELERAIPEPVLDQFAFLIEGVIPTTYHVMIRFGKWEDVLLEPAPPAKRPVMLAVHHYARGIAFAALGRTDESRREIAAFRAQVPNVPADWWIFSNKIHDVLPIAHAMLEGELAFREGRLDDAWRALRRGIDAEDKLVYDEPPGWMIPVRHAMGALMMSAGEYAQAEQLYREDQVQHPGNGWSMLGLRQALLAQGRADEAAHITPKLNRAWKRVANRPTSSCLCEPGAG
jgi:tetratricopeptide (TPR) repeat protein